MLTEVCGWCTRPLVKIGSGLEISNIPTITFTVRPVQHVMIVITPGRPSHIQASPIVCLPGVGVRECEGMQTVEDPLQLSPGKSSYSKYMFSRWMTRTVTRTVSQLSPAKELNNFSGNQLPTIVRTLYAKKAGLLGTSELHRERFHLMLLSSCSRVFIPHDATHK